ncbi:MAG: PhnD/SsuA/transferrin family substrate-binding protein [Halopseudomonas sp.]
MEWNRFRFKCVGVVALLSCLSLVKITMAAADTILITDKTSLADAVTDRELKVAVLAYRGSERALNRWASTMAYLNEHIPGYHFKAMPMNLAQLDQAVLDASIDFAITNAGQFVRLGSKQGMSWLATLKSRRHKGRGPVIGSALLVRADSNYHSLEDLQHTRLGAVSPLAFGGFQIYWGEMASQGYRPEQFFGEIKFSDFPVGALAFWVRDGLVDAAVVPACMLETLAEEGLIDFSAYRVIGAKSIVGFDCLTSSQLYPNWSFSTLKSTPPTVAEQVAQVLLLLPVDASAAVDSGSLGWTAPVSSYDIHQLYQRLDIHPWQQPWWLEMRAWLLRNWQWSLTLLVLMILGFCHHLWVQLMMQKRTRELQTMHDELMHQQQQLEHAQRVAILGELSSNLAHELNQPLAAINSYAEGGIIRQQTGAAELDVSGLLAKISAEAQRGGHIIERVRGFVLNGEAKREWVDLVVLVAETLKLLDYELKKYQLELQLELQQAPLMASVDPVEIQQLLVNLVRNGIEAMSQVPGPHRLRVGARAESSSNIMLWVEDSGKGVGEASLETLSKSFYSTKPDGLGLGMSICRRIVEAHDGRIEMTPGAEGGTRLVCMLAGGSHG